MKRKGEITNFNQRVGLGTKLLLQLLSLDVSRWKKDQVQEQRARDTPC